MKLLGNYDSNLVSYHRDELLKLLTAALAAGDWGGGKLVDSTVATKIQADASDFSSLPAIPAGSRADVRSIGYPLDVLMARFNAIAQERVDFLSRMDLFLSVLEKDTGLIDQLIAAAAMETWVSRKGALGNAVKFYQDFAATHGYSTTSMPQTDPATAVLYESPVSDVTLLLNGVAGLEAEPLRSGIGVPVTATQVSVINLRWHHTSTGEVEELSGSDWAKLSLLEDRPMVRFGQPQVTVEVPVGGSVTQVLRVSGSEAAGNLPVFVRLFSSPRRMVRTIVTGDAGLEVPTSNYKLLGDDFVVRDDTRSYDQGLDYKVDAIGRFVPLTATANKTLTLYFTVMFPAYTCSINQQDWSTPLLFNQDDPYPDDAGEMQVVSISNGKFPVLDETGKFLGLYLELLSIPKSDYLIRIDSQVLVASGSKATLEVELDRPLYLNSFHLAPFCNYPVRLRQLRAEGLTEDSGRVLYTGDWLIDRSASICFERQLVHRLYLDFEQENYEIKAHRVDAADKLRREVLVNLQSVLPYSSRRIHIAVPLEVEGAQYEFGLHELYGEDRPVSFPENTGVITLGPFEVKGNPELLRLDVDYSGLVKCYLIDTPFLTDTVQTGSAFHVTNPNGIEVQPGVAFSYTPPPDVAVLAKVQFYVKFVLKSQYAVVERFLLEATNHVQ